VSSAAAEPAASAKPAEPEQDHGTRATVAIESKSGSKLKGTAQFEPSAAGVKINVEITDAPPGAHGAHIHQTADCSDKEAKSAGDHFNPTMHDHGLPPTDTRHLGDLGNIEVSKDGKGHLEITVASANMKRGDKLSFMDRAIIIHEKPDNGGQPSGNAGKRIGCGEIK
jgi:Cu-Zn family superoxide dismutase